MKAYVVNAGALAGGEEELLPLLTPERREKVLRLRDPMHRRCALAAGLLLRRYLGGYSINVTAEGKPFAAGEGAPCFNLSHSGERAVLALSEAPLGVDIEKTGPFRAGVARRVFTEAERQTLGEGDGDRFTRLWTRKEALLKCLGCGLARPMNGFSVLEDSVVAEGSVWQLQSLPLDGYWLSVASARRETLELRPLTIEELTSRRERETP